APLPWIGAYADKIALGLVILLLTYASLVIGELVPKRLAMTRPEGISIFMARPMLWLSTIASPAVWFLSWSTDRILALIGLSQQEENGLSKEEVAVMVKEGINDGTFHRVESDLVEGVFDLAQVTVEGIMTPRLQIVWLQINDLHDSIWHKI